MASTRHPAALQPACAAPSAHLPSGTPRSARWGTQKREKKGRHHDLGGGGGEGDVEAELAALGLRVKQWVYVGGACTT